MSPTQYQSEYPQGLDFGQSYRDFISEFYHISDTPDAHDLYVKQFAPDARLVMASKTGNGSEEILSMRKALWEKVKSRSHKATKVFPFGPNSNEIMLYGNVNYEFKEEFGGGKSGLEWAARGTLSKSDDGRVVWQDYQVFMDTAAQQVKK